MCMGILLWTNTESCLPLCRLTKGALLRDYAKLCVIPLAMITASLIVRSDVLRSPDVSRVISFSTPWLAICEINR